MVRRRKSCLAKFTRYHVLRHDLITQTTAVATTIRGRQRSRLLLFLWHAESVGSHRSFLGFPVDQSTTTLRVIFILLCSYCLITRSGLPHSVLAQITAVSDGMHPPRLSRSTSILGLISCERTHWCIFCSISRRPCKRCLFFMWLASTERNKLKQRSH